MCIYLLMLTTTVSCIRSSSLGSSLKSLIQFVMFWFSLFVGVAVSIAVMKYHEQNAS